MKTSSPFACACVMLHAIVLAGPGLVAAGGCSKEPPTTGLANAASSAKTHGDAVRPALQSVALVDLGLVALAGRVDEVIALKNRGTTAVTISRVETSCDCLRVSLSEREVAAGGFVAARVMLDLAGEPDFIGNLQADVVGYSASGERLVGFQVRVLVDDKAAVFTIASAATRGAAGP